ncbi:hypothetical protein F4810DRAFT_248086 [Camillea tinctor]|nr:hypothetical protein F4810DRAFT_248086 [Camillea tinctor]
MPMDQDDDSDNSGIGYYPFAWVLIPIVFFGLVAVLLTCYRYRRRRHAQALWEQQNANLRHHPHNRPPFPPHDLEAGAPGRARSGRTRRLGFGFGSRDEGLNELGEAPPAYAAATTAAAQKPPVDVELRDMTQREAEVGTSGRLPRYEEAQGHGQGEGAATTIAPPPRVVLPSS